jgi:hypothetical protein
MLTKEELALIEMTADLWNRFLALPNSHPADAEEMALDIHRIQNRIMARSARRDHPDVFR